jgi:hypothetical protein
MRRCRAGVNPRLIRIHLLAFLLIGNFLSANALAAVTVCVEIEAEKAESEGLRKLVLSEMARHPSHRVVEEGCDTVLSVHLFEVEDKRYLTARIGEEVPVRYRLGKGDTLDNALREGLSLVLGSDPVYLAKDITRYSRMERARHSVLEKGHNIWRVELFEIMARGEKRLTFASGAAFSATRGADHVRVFARIHVAGRPGRLGLKESALRMSSGIDLGIAYEVSAHASSTFYLGGGLGVQYLMFEGRLTVEGAPTTEVINEVFPAPFVRLGARFLRMYDFDLDLFVSFHLPLFKVRDQDSPLFGEKGLYTPFAQLGLGVGF